MRRYEDVGETVALLTDIARLLEDLERKVKRFEKEVIRGRAEGSASEKG